MVDFTAGYQPPGVYVETQSTGSVAAVGIGGTVVCLVGDGVGHETNTENVSFASASQVVLAKKYIDPASVVVTAVLDSGPATFLVDASVNTPHDYAVAVDATTHLATITRHSSGTIPTDRPVTVTYNYADDAYYGLNRFNDFATFTQVYGDPLVQAGNNAGAVASPLSFAAEQAFRNGANLLYAVAIDPRAGGSREAQFKAAYNKILPTYEINLVVPLITDAVDTASATTFLADVSAFLDNAESQGYRMTAVCGVMGSYASTDPDTLATGVSNRRVVFLWPPKLTHFNSVLNSSTDVDGIYVAAAVAGALVDQDLNRGLTRTQVKGFTAIPASTLNAMTTSKKNTWSSKGVAVIEPNRSGQLVIRHGVTTDVSDIGNREVSIVRCQDALFEGIQLSLEGADLIGDPITTNTPLMVSSLITGALENALAEGIIQSYTGLVVNQGQLPTGDPTVIQVTFSYQPVYPLNYITVSFTLDLTTNALTSSLATSNSTSLTAP